MQCRGMPQSRRDLDFSRTEHPQRTDGMQRLLRRLSRTRLSPKQRNASR